VLTIAHRLATVMACDRVMVLGDGRCVSAGACMFVPCSIVGACSVLLLTPPPRCDVPTRFHLSVCTSSVLEMGNPQELSADPSTIFHEMTSSSSAAQEMLK
jgi:hypothetical protein